MLTRQQKRIAVSLREGKPTIIEHDDDDYDMVASLWRRRVYDEHELSGVGFEDWKEFEAIAGVNE